jgi:hypothetical protein
MRTVLHRQQIIEWIVLEQLADDILAATAASVGPRSSPSAARVRETPELIDARFSAMRAAARGKTANGNGASGTTH